MTNRPESAFHAYMQAVETLDPEKALPFYHLPSMFIAPQGVFPVPDTNTARASLLPNFLGSVHRSVQARPKASSRVQILFNKKLYK